LAIDAEWAFLGIACGAKSIAAVIARPDRRQLRARGSRQESENDQPDVRSSIKKRRPAAQLKRE
jgi:hypothetical protein